MSMSCDGYLGSGRRAGAGGDVIGKWAPGPWALHPGARRGPLGTLSGKSQCCRDWSGA